MTTKTAQIISFVILCLALFPVFAQTSDSSASVLNIIPDPLRINTITVSPGTRMVLINTTFNATMNATSGHGIDKEYAIITFPNGSSVFQLMPITYAAPITGVFNITFYANDTIGRIANSSNYFYSDEIFIVGNQISAIQTNFINGTVYEVNGTLTTYLADGSLLIYNFTCEETCTYNYIVDYLYNYKYGFEEDKVEVTLYNVNNTIDDNNTIAYQRTVNPQAGDVLIVGIDTNYESYTSAKLRMNYTDTNYTYEDNLSIYKCSEWNFTNENCTTNWSIVTSGVSQDKALNIFDINADSFSAYKIDEPIITSVCGDSVCEGTETNSNCPEDCPITRRSGGGGGNYPGIIYTSEQKQEWSYIDVESVSDTIKERGLVAEVMPGRETKSYLTLENKFSNKLLVDVEINGYIRRFFKNPAFSLTLEPEEKRELLFTIIASENDVPGIYQGEIEMIFNNKAITTIPAEIRVLSPIKRTVEMNLEKIDYPVHLGEEIPLAANIYLFNTSEKQDVAIHFELLDNSLNKIYEWNDEATLKQEKTTLVQNVKIPLWSVPGTYSAVATLNYKSEGIEKSTSSSSSFKVYINYLYIIIVLCIILVITTTILLGRKQKNKNKK